MIIYIMCIMKLPRELYMIDSATFRRVLGHYPTGVCVITSTEPSGRPIGMSIGSFTSVSLDPPLVAFFPDRRSTSWERMRDTGHFCVNVLGDHQEAISRRFATPAADKFIGISHRASNLGLPILDGVLAWIDCQLHTVHEVGDHFIVVGKVASLAVEHSAQPLLFHKGGYGQLSPVALSSA
jgi:3-hydroxy-9,10-secoandrosta-1,3,5(10)-triene-9,17-dione monooxygenase reductase component